MSDNGNKPRINSRQKGSVTHWIEGIRDGNDAAAQKLWNRYYIRLVDLARSELKNANRRVSDEEDVALEVIEGFFRAAAQGRYPDLADRAGLWRLLVQMTAHKAVDQYRRSVRKKRGGGLVRGESVFFNSDQRDTNAIVQVIGDQPTPEFAIEMAEQLKRLLDLLDDPTLKAIAVGKMEGYTNAELSVKFDCSQRTIDRRLNLIRVRLNEEFLT